MREPPSHKPNSQQSQPEPSFRQTNAGSMGGGQQAARGNKNIQSQGNNNWLGNTWNFIVGQSQTTPTTQLTRQEYRNRQALLTKVKNFWVKGVLEKSLYNQVLIELGLEERPDAITNPWNVIIETVDDSPQPLPEGTKVIDILNQIGAGRTLLILGEPGSGKTTTLLELTRDLIARAEQDVNLLIPVVFNLSSWVNKRQKIEDWLVEELGTKYDVPKAIREHLVKKQQLLPLLDGLDEVNAEYRDDCITALNQFKQDYGAELVVCSRIRDYEALSNRLNFQSAVYIRLLTLEQICHYLDEVGTDLAGLRALITEDRVLQELAKSPLMLNIMTLAYQGVAVEDLPKTEVVEERRKQLFNDYTEKMFHRPNRSKVEQKYSEVQAKRWLTWLAQRLSQYQSLFFIEEMQPNWLLTDKYIWMYIFCSRLIGGLVFVFPFFLIRLFEPTNIQVVTPTVWSALFSSIALSLIDGYFMNFQNQAIAYLETQNINYWHLVCDIIATELIFGFIFGFKVQLPIGLLMGLPFGLFFGLLFGLRGMRRSISCDIKTFDVLNWSWKNSIQGAIFALIISSVFSLLIGVLVPEYKSQIRLVIMLIGGALGTVFGGLRSANVEPQTKSIPNQGIQYSRRSAATGAIIGALVGALVGISRGRNYLYAVETFSTLGMSMGTLWYGGLDFIQHFTLRLILYHNNYIPWNYARFLDYATERIFLQKVGGGYIFIHRMLMEHFAQMEIES